MATDSHCVLLKDKWTGLGGVQELEGLGTSSGSLRNGKWSLFAEMAVPGSRSSGIELRWSQVWVTVGDEDL